MDIEGLLRTLLNPGLMGDQRKQEYVVLRKPDNTVQMSWGPTNGDGKNVPHEAAIPPGHYTSIEHNHPNGTTLSYTDLRLLKDHTDRIEAKGNKDYSATRGPNFNALDDTVGNILYDLHNSPRQPKLGPQDVQQDYINRELGKRGVINYSENPLENALIQRTPIIKQ